MQTLFNYQIYLTLWDAHMYFFFSYPYSSVCIWKMQEKESLLANLRLTTSQATSNQTAAVYTSPVPTEGGILKSKNVLLLLMPKYVGGEGHMTHPLVLWFHRVGCSRQYSCLIGSQTAGALHNKEKSISKFKAQNKLNKIHV